MDDVGDEYKFANARLPGRLYVSKRFRFEPDQSYIRFAHRAFPSDAMPVLVKEHEDIILRTTSKGVQQVKAKFLEDDRSVPLLWFQRWSVAKGWPIGEQVVFVGSEIPRLIEFMNSIAKLHIQHEGTFNVDFADLRLVHLRDEDGRRCSKSIRTWLQSSHGARSPQKTSSH